jgi:hypothetical protein|tara:strand:+ start:1650 stop:2120 length:471 start_codon:yes stop_codon:yes gene_type:complete
MVSILELASSISNKYKEFPAPLEPEWGESFRFPVDADTLNDAELDTWMLKLGAWRGYVSALASTLEGQLAVIEPAFEMKVGAAMSTVDLPSDRRTVKEIVRSLAIIGSIELTEIWNELLRLKGEVKILQKKYEYYTQQFETISRVVSRRGQEKMRL